MDFDQPSFLITAVMALGVSSTLVLVDPQDKKNRPLALCLFFIGLSLLLGGFQLMDGSVFWSLLDVALQSLAMLFGMEWARRIGQEMDGRRRIAAHYLFRVAQLLVVIYGLLYVGYIILEPTLATTDSVGFFRARGFEFAIFAPLIGTAVLCGAIAILLLLSMRLDKAEAQRLLMLWHSTPFLMLGLVINPKYVPFTITIGLLLLIAGSIRYFIVQGKRGQFLSQFLSPEVSKMVNQEGLDTILRRQRRVLSVVVCDLRGFTHYARTHDSNDVIQLLEDFYKAVGIAASQYNGTIKDHAGDGVLILVGAPLAVAEHEQLAVNMALEISQLGRQVLTQAGLHDDLGLGVGVATGSVTIGAIKGAGRLEYVAVGNPVNLAARLCDRANDGEILSDNRTYEAIKNTGIVAAQQREPEPLKGFPQPIEISALFAKTAIS